MKTNTQQRILFLNPWLNKKNHDLMILDEGWVQRHHDTILFDSEWDSQITLFTGPRQSGKTTLAKMFAAHLLQQKRFDTFLYLNCDFYEIRDWVTSAEFLHDIEEVLALTHPVVLIDEAQRLKSPGLTLKGLVDLNRSIKWIATGSSQLELRSEVQEFLTGRHFEVRVLPFNESESEQLPSPANRLLFGSYPNVLKSKYPERVLAQLFEDYLSKDIVEILKIGDPDVMRKLLILLAHSSGQLVNYQQLATDCQAKVTKVQNYCEILEKTYVLQKLTPFVGNKRTEITSNPIYYFVDNGFRNQALQNFLDLESRTDKGLLIESYVFQELLKWKAQTFFNGSLHYWRTKSGAEVDFVITRGEKVIPIEAKYRSMDRAKVTRGFRSFLQAYQPTHAFCVTKNYIGTCEVEKTHVTFLPLSQLSSGLIQKLAEMM